MTPKIPVNTSTAQLPDWVRKTANAVNGNGLALDSLGARVTILEGGGPPVTSVDNAVVRFDGTTGHIQGSGVTIDDSGNIITAGMARVGDGVGGSPGAGMTLSYATTGGFLSSSTNGSTTNTIGVAGSQHSFFCGSSLAALNRALLLQSTTITLGGIATAATVDFTIMGHLRSGTDSLGGNLTISSGRGTGSGTASVLTFQTPTATGSGATAQTMATRLTLGSTNAVFTVPVIEPAYTVAALPSPSPAYQRAFASDALAPAFGSPVVGGGAVKIPVYSDGTNWLVG